MKLNLCWLMFVNWLWEHLTKISHLWCFNHNKMKLNSGINRKRTRNIPEFMSFMLWFVFFLGPNNCHMVEPRARTLSNKGSTNMWQLISGPKKTRKDPSFMKLKTQLNTWSPGSGQLRRDKEMFSFLSPPCGCPGLQDEIIIKA